MTRAEYLSPERFPLTTVPGLPTEWQRRLDAANLAWLEELADGGRELTGVHRRRLKELLDKAAAVASLRADAEQLRAWRGRAAAGGAGAMPPAPHAPPNSPSPRN